MVTDKKYYGKVRRGKAPWFELVRKDFTANVRITRQNQVVGQKVARREGRKIGMSMEAAK